MGLSDASAVCRPQVTLLNTPPLHPTHTTPSTAWLPVMIYDNPYFKGSSITYTGPRNIDSDSSHSTVRVCLVADGWKLGTTARAPSASRRSRFTLLNVPRC
jgi:hypothetical protein